MGRLLRVDGVLISFELLFYVALFASLGGFALDLFGLLASVWCTGCLGFGVVICLV